MTWTSTPDPVLTNQLMAHQHAERVVAERAAVLEELVVDAVSPGFFARFRQGVVKPALAYGVGAFVPVLSKFVTFIAVAGGIWLYEPAVKLIDDLVDGIDGENND